MKYYFGHVTTKYMGMEWGHHFLVRASTFESAERKANKVDWTHGDGSEEQGETWVQEIPERHYQILRQYLLTVGEEEDE